MRLRRVSRQTTTAAELDGELEALFFWTHCRSRVGFIAVHVEVSHFVRLYTF